MRRHLSALALCVLCAAGTATSSAADPAAATPVQPQPATPLIAPAELAKRIEGKDPDLVVLDVRTAREFEAGHVPGALNIPHDQLGARLEELASLRDKQIVLYCRSGKRSLYGAAHLLAVGFTDVNSLAGGIIAWAEAGQPIEY